MPCTVFFTDEEWTFYHSLCQEYARNELESTFAQKNRRNQFNKNAMVHQTTTGKLAEWGVALHCMDKAKNITDPDMKIYKAAGKSFDADLQLDGEDLHVKSQSVDSAQRFGTSWMFQYGGHGFGHTDPLLKKQNGSVAFCVVDFEQKSVTIHGICNFDTLRKRLREPVKESLKKTKRCIYLEDLTEDDFLDII